MTPRGQALRRAARCQARHHLQGFSGLELQPWLSPPACLMGGHAPTFWQASGHRFNLCVTKHDCSLP